MTIGKYLKYIGVLVAAMLMMGVGYAASSFNINSLSKGFSKKKSVKVAYVQRRILNFSKRPIMSSGYLIYKKPNYFAQVQLRPKQRTLIAKSGWLMVIVNGKVQRREKLSSYPNMQVQLRTLKSVLSGKINSLKTSFKLSLQGSLRSWILSLKPKRRNVGNVSYIQINGQQANIEALSLHYQNGNITTLSLSGT